jgi:PAS domain S-box-containing protein
MLKKSLNTGNCKKEDKSNHKFKLTAGCHKIILQNAMEVFFATDIVGNILEVNDAMCQKFGYSQDELLSMKLSDFDLEVLNHPESMLGACGKIRKVGGWTRVRHVRCKDGSILDFETNSKYLDISTGIIFHFGRDVTERNKLYQQLKESEERYRALIELGDRVGEAIVLLQDTDKGKGMQIFVSEKWADITGYSREELLDMSFFDLLSSRYLKDSIERHRRKLNGESIPQHFEMSIIRKDSKEVPIEFTSSYTTYQGNKANVAYIRDITERKQWEYRFKTILQTTQDGFFLSDLKGNILDVNDAFCSMLGYSRDEILSMTVSDFDADYIEASKKFRQDILKVKQDIGAQREVRHRCKDGRIINVAISVKYLDIKPGFFFCFHRDITKQKRLEKDLKQYSEHLEELVEKRTTELAKSNKRLEREIIERQRAHTKLQEYYHGEQLLRQKLEKEIAEHKKTEQKLKDQIVQRARFMRMLVHELKTPLTPLLNISESLLTKHGEETIKEQLNILNRGATRLSKRIDELMDLSKGETGLLEIEKKSVDLLSLLEDVTTYMEPYILKREQVLIKDIPQSLPLILGDGERLWQVVNNLLDNASKFTPKKGKIMLHARATEASVVIEIQNSGASLTEEQRQNIFQPYYSLHSHREGLGLGLVLAKMLVELHGGQIWAKEYNGKGNIFGFSLPVHSMPNQKQKRSPV